MAAVPTPDLVTITVNEQELQVPKGELIVEAVKRLGLEVPIFCYHPRMKPVGMCRMCFVEVGFKGPDGVVKKMPKPQAACTLPASEGMAIFTNTEAVHKDRKGVLEFLLINHPLDCPICDRGGECPLQNNTLFYGPSTSRFTEIKRHLPKAFPLSQYVTLDLERCIQCGRCVRFTEEISGDSQLAFRFRGAMMQPSTFELTDFDSKFSGNVIEICPVGALTSAKYRFRARPWDLETSPSICTVCSNGCNVWFDHRYGKFVRINGRTNEAVNEEWTCDRGKFGHEFYNAPDRLTQPLMRKGDAFVEAGWATAYDSILDKFRIGGSKVAVLAGPQVPNEALFLLQRLFRNGFKSQNIDHRWTRHMAPHAERIINKLGVPAVQSTIESLEHKKVLFVFGGNLADDLPIVFLRVRKAWFNSGAKVIVASDRTTDADSFAHLVLHYKPGTESVLAHGIIAHLIAEGKAQVPQSTAEFMKSYTPEHVESITGVPSAKIREAAMLAAESTIITSQQILNVDGGHETTVSLAATAMCTGGEFNMFTLSANTQGAIDLGILPDTMPGGGLIEGSNGLDTRSILEACANGEISALWLVGCDPLSDFYDHDLAQRALETVDYLVYQHFSSSDSMGYASVVLPMAAPAEQDGSYTSCECRVQRLKPAVPPPGDAKPGWRIFSEIMVREHPSTPFFHAHEVMDEIANEIPRYADARYQYLDGEGAIVPLR